MTRCWSASSTEIRTGRTSSRGCGIQTTRRPSVGASNSRTEPARGRRNRLRSRALVQAERLIVPTQTASNRLVRAASLQELRAAGRLVVHVDRHTLCLFADSGEVYAIDNRCPHMGFPLHRGTLQDGILTCHWHHARFDLTSGGTFDQFADEARVFPVEIRDNEVWVDLSPREDRPAYLRQRLRDGLERDISLVVSKSVIGLLGSGEDPAEPFRAGLEFGSRYRRAGWGQGLTMHACMMNLLPHLAPEDRPRALYHGLSAVSRDSAGQPPRFSLRPLPTETVDLATLKIWFRRFVEVRDSEGAERC